MKTTTKLWLGIGVLILLSPLGLLLPEHFKAGDAWGEWELEGKLSNLWSAPIPDYAFKGWEEKGLRGLSFAYMASAAIGILVVVCVMFGISQLLRKKGNTR